MKFYRDTTLLVVGVHGWGERGHKLTASVAAKVMTQSTADWVHKEIRSCSDFEQAMQEVSVWADNDGHSEETGDYHFVHTPFRQCLPYVEARDCGFGGSGRCLVTGIRKYVEEAINSESLPDVRSTAVRMLIHLIADLHQPMHLGFAENHGGLDLELVGEETANLHHFWDEVNISLSEYDTLRGKQLASIHVKNPVPSLPDDHLAAGAIIHEFVSSVVSRFTAELTCPEAYRDNGAWIANYASLSPAYHAGHIGIVETQILAGGAMLGRLLNLIASVWIAREKKAKRQADDLKAIQEDQVRADAEVDSQYQNNRYTFLTVEEFDFDPMVIVRDCATLATKKEVAPREEPTNPYGIRLSSLGMMQTSPGKKEWVITTLDNIHTKGTLFMECYELFFRRNTKQTGRRLNICFDNAVFMNQAVLRDHKFVLEVLGWLKGAPSVPSSGAETQMRIQNIRHRNNADALILGYPELLPELNDPSVDLVPFTTPLGSHKMYLKREGQIRSLKTDADEIYRAIRITQTVAERMFPGPQSVEAYQAFMMKKKCADIVTVVSRDCRNQFISTVQAMQGPPRTLFKAARYQIHQGKSGRASLNKFVDVHLTTAPLMGTNMEEVIKCAYQPGNVVVSRALDTKGRYMAMLGELRDALENAALREDPQHIKRLVTYPEHALAQLDVLIVEWEIF